jgi:hypothetical protein
MTNFTIRAFDDYHEIHSETQKTIELGCFPEKGRGYCRYFGLFYKGRKPSVSAVIQRLKRRIDFGDISHYRTGTDISITKEELEAEVKGAL